MTASRQTERLVFVLTLVGVAYFHQGGGWNQNARFALVRAIVESQSFSIDDYLVYGRDPADAGALVRRPVRRATFGQGRALGWSNERGKLVPIDPDAARGMPVVALDAVAASGDVAYFDGHFHPNKAPGASFAAVPGYALLRGAERIAGLSPDRWSVLTANAWLMSVLSVGVATAIGAVLVLRLARSLGSELDAVLTALTFAFGTMAWPLGTLLWEHNLVATALVAAFANVEAARTASASNAERRLIAAGACAGWAAITNYTMLALVVALGGYAVTRTGERRAALSFAAGVAGPLLLLGAYNAACFGTPFTTNYAYESPMFVSAQRVLGVFALPRVDVLVTLLFSPYRGLFFTSPVLLLAIAGLVGMALGRETRPWACAVAAVLAFVLLVNASFNGWDGGWTAVPRYLGPAMPFAALPLAAIWRRWRAAACALAVLSIGIQGVITAVDAQPPIGDANTVSPMRLWGVDPLMQYEVPLFLGHAPRAVAGGAPVAVSANHIGVYEASSFTLYPSDSREAVSNSMNAGELLFPESRMALLPLLCVAGALAYRLISIARRTSPPAHDHEPVGKAL